jgi:hypothetical protein
VTRLQVSDRWLAIGAALAVFLVYLRTLLPDVGGYEDTPKFQYLGAVLGTAHRPGYPLYVLLLHLFSYLPVGTMAYRADLVSAAAGAVAVAHVFLFARFFQCGRAASWFGAVSVGLGAAFWNYSAVAEVYTLAALLLVATLYWMARWGESGRPLHLYAASAWFALALGNHLSIVMAAPAIVVFLLLAPARRTLTLRSVLTAALIVASGFLQYSYVLIRTWQGAPWREAAAENVGEVVSLFSTRTYNEFVLPATWHELSTNYLPTFAGWARLEFGWAGTAVALAGLAWTFHRKWNPALLLLLSAAGTTGLLLHLVGDLRGFLVPVWALVGVFLAVGADGIARAVHRLPGRTWAGASAVVLVFAPGWLLASNFKANDWSTRTEEGRQLRMLARSLPAPAVVLAEDYVVDSMLTYLRVIERDPVWQRVPPRPPDPLEVRTLFEEGYRVLAFQQSRDRLVGLGFDFDPVDVGVQSLAQRIRELPSGATVAIAVCDTWLSSEVRAALGLDAAAARSMAPRFAAIVARVGAAPELVESSAEARVEAEGITAEASATGAWITAGGQIVSAVPTGLAVLVVDPRRKSSVSYRLASSDELVAGPSPYTPYQLTGLLPVMNAGGNIWTDVTSVAAGWMTVTVNNYREFLATTTAYVVAPTPLRPALDEALAILPAPTFDVRLFDRAQERDRTALIEALAGDGLPLENLGTDRFVARVFQTVNDRGQSASWGLSLGAIPTRVWLRGMTDQPSRPRVTAMPSDVDPLLRQPGIELINAGYNSDRLFGSGWSRPERDGSGGFRWATDPEAHVVLPITGDAGLRIGLVASARATTSDPYPTVALSINGHNLNPCPLPDGLQRCWWDVPASAVRDGANHIVVRSSSVSRPADSNPLADTRTLGVAVKQIILKR